ncbi:MAG: PTS sugar transporter subunit IIA [Opitutales bacterium]|nr:PTS sugar transporter subunit IIA [Opitutales bacterium]
MRLEKFLSKSRLIDLKSSDFEGALREMLDTVSDAHLGGASRSGVLSSMLEREKGISTYLGNSVCMPHARIETLKQRYVFVVGRCKNGLQFNGSEQYANVRLVFLLLSRANEPTYLSVLAAAARIFSNGESAAKIISSPSLNEFRDTVFSAFSSSEYNRASVAKRNILFLRNADRIARGSKCAAVVVFGDTFTGGISLEGFFKGMRTILISGRNSSSENEMVDEIVNVHSFSTIRMGHLKSALLVALSKGIIKPTDKICYIGGMSGSDKIDTVMVFDIAKEFAQLYLESKEALPAGVKPEVMERVIDIASALSYEGREGKPVGAFFILGDYEKIKPYIKQLVLNPFLGYRDEDRNVLSPFMDETVKEYSLIDGAFVIDGSGVLATAGALVHAPDFVLKIPGGLGARHAAAYSISLAVDCMAFVVSSSTSRLTLFRNGQMIPISKPR